MELDAAARLSAAAAPLVAVAVAVAVVVVVFSMETLKPEAPLATREPVVLVERGLPVGVYRVQLVVEGRTGKSAPAALVIRVIKE